MWQSDLENTNERPLYKPSQDQNISTALGGAWKFVDRCIELFTDQNHISLETVIPFHKYLSETNITLKAA